MGCFWSSHESEYSNQHRRPHLNSSVVTREQVYVSRETRQVPVQLGQPKPCFGEYRCPTCRRTWSSRLAWTNNYQICKRCRNHVYPYTTRPLRASDMSDHAKEKKHPKELCHKCQQLGYYCGNPRRQKLY